MIFPRIPSRYIIFGVLTIVYLLIYFQRTSMSAISENLMIDLHLNASDLGTISSSYFLSYALILPLVGYLTDKYGPKKVIVGFFLFTSLSSLLFGFVNDFSSALIARSLIGFGSAGIFVPALALLSKWFKNDQFGKVNGLFVGLGTLGSLLATFPLSYLDFMLGWRSFFILFAITGIAFTTVLMLFIRYNKTNESTVKSKNKSVKYFETIKRIVFTYNFTLLQIVIFVSCGVYLSFIGLWATKYIMEALDTSSQVANSIILFLPLGCVIGSPLGGFLSDNIFHSRKIPLCMALVMQTICWLILTLFVGSVSSMLISVILFLLGVFSGMIAPLVFCLLKDSVPAENYGFSLGLLNPSMFVGIFVFQLLTSYILDYNSVNSDYTEHSFFLMMSFCSALLIISTIVGFFIRENNQNAYLKKGLKITLDIKPIYKTIYSIKNIISFYHIDFYKSHSNVLAVKASIRQNKNDKDCNIK